MGVTLFPFWSNLILPWLVSETFHGWHASFVGKKMHKCLNESTSLSLLEYFGGRGTIENNETLFCLFPWSWSAMLIVVDSLPLINFLIGWIHLRVLNNFFPFISIYFGLQVLVVITPECFRLPFWLSLSLSCSFTNPKKRCLCNYNKC